MPEIDNCPVCNTPCEIETGPVDKSLLGIGTEIVYATCKTCKARWRRKSGIFFGKLIYEKWACRMPEINIPFPFLGGGIKIHPRWCRWMKIKEKRILTEFERKIREKPTLLNGKTYDETISIPPKKHAIYEFEASRNSGVKGEISSNLPVDIWFLDEKNFDKYDRKKSFEIEDETDGIFQAKINFMIRNDGSWFVILVNINKTEAKVKVYLHV